MEWICEQHAFKVRGRGLHIKTDSRNPLHWTGYLLWPSSADLGTPSNLQRRAWRLWKSMHCRGRVKLVEPLDTMPGTALAKRITAQARGLGEQKQLEPHGALGQRRCVNVSDARRLNTWSVIAGRRRRSTTSRRVMKTSTSDRRSTEPWPYIFFRTCQGLNWQGPAHKVSTAAKVTH